MRFAAAALSLAFAAPAGAAAEPEKYDLGDLAFLEGQWVSDRNGFVIEESWSDEAAGVVVSNSRGVQNGGVRFLRYAVIQQTADGVVMRFKRFNADYTTWEANGPTTLRLVAADGVSTVFEAEDASFDVQRIVYRATDKRTIEVEANRTDADGPYVVRFTLSKVD